MTTLAKTPSFLASESQETSESQTIQSPDWYFSTVVSFFSVSLAVNALVTGLIIFKTFTVYRRAAHAGRRRRDMALFIPILIESGLITFVAQLVQTLMFKFANTAYPIIVGLVVMLYVRVLLSIVDLMGFDYIYLIVQGISTAIVLVRVEMGLTYDVNNESSKTDTFAESQCCNDVRVTTMIT